MLRMKVLSRILGAVVLLACHASSCDLQFQPIARTRYYVEEGWRLPGIDDDPTAPVNMYGIPIGRVQGAKTYPVRHRETPYVVEFPSQVVISGNVRQRMGRVLAKANIVRIEMNGQTVAYSYA